MSKPTLHVIAPFHTEPNSNYSHCAFTGKAERLVEMMAAQGYRVVEYSNGVSDSAKFASVRHEILSGEELADLRAQQLKKDGTTGDFWANYSIIGGFAHSKFCERLKPALAREMGQTDIVCHVFGHCHQDLVSMGGIHVETGIGYSHVWAPFKIFETYAWLHYHQGKAGGSGTSYEWVVPNYYRTEEWPTNLDPEGYLLFAGRVGACKGLATIVEIINKTGLPVKVAGQGAIDEWRGMIRPEMRNLLEHVGIVNGTERAKLYGNAKAIICPSAFVEPFCGVSAEAMMTGTPVISVHYGAFSETVEHGKTGFRCRTLNDYVEAIGRAGDLDRKYIADRAKRMFSLETCGKKYDAAFRQIHDIHAGGGWYTCPHELDAGI